MAGELCEDKSRDMASSSAGFCYPDISSANPTIPNHLLNQIQGFVSDPEMFNLTAGMEMIGFSKNPQCPSSSTNFYHDSAAWQDNRLLVDDSSIRCVFPCEGNERPSQGLSLSLSSSNPSGIGLQSFELKHTNNQQQLEDFVSSSSREGFFGKAANLYQGHFLLKNSKYLVPAQELLNEFCSLGTKQSDVLRQKSHKNKQWEEDNGSGSSMKHPLISSLEFVELHKRKTKLLSMLEEVDRRYRHYCNQMKAVVSSYEAVAGNGAATVYSALALKAMSRHFKCLKDGILGQLEATRKGMGEKDPVAPGTTRGETPKLKIIDQKLRQQKAFQQTNMMETHPWRPQRGLPEPSVCVLRAWLFEHFLHPYPSDVDKHILARQTGLSRSQVSNWFINARVRLWKPMVEEMYVEEMKEHENNGACSDPGDNVGKESESMSSIMNNPLQKNDQNILVGVSTDTFGSVELDFSGGMVSYKGGNVSLTLGLQQHGVRLGETQSSVFYQREQMDDCEVVEYSLLEGQGQHLPYNKHLMGVPLHTHMLHDFAG